MAISNCSSCGSDSYANPLTGIVSRKDKITGEEKLASVRPSAEQASPEITGKTSVSDANLAEVVKSNLEAVKTKANVVNAYTQQQQNSKPNQIIEA